MQEGKSDICYTAAGSRL